MDPAEAPRHDYLTRAELLKGGAVLLGAGSLAGVLAGCGSSSSPAAATTGTTTTRPRRGGTLKIAYIGGGTSELLDPNGPVADIDDARAQNLFDPLVNLSSDYSLIPYLAESFTPNSKFDLWTVRLRSGVTFHDGSPLTADDVIYTITRICNPKLGLVGLSISNFIDPKQLRKRDQLTVEIPLTQPNNVLPYFFAFDYMAIVKDGTTNFDHPNGTGPFKFVRWKPGQYSIFTRNENYWQHGKPYVDTLELLSIPDQTARYDALVAGQVHGIESLTYAQATTQKHDKQFRVLESPPVNIVPIYMAVTLAPFQDVRVRQAMRLIADRPQLVEEAQSGYGAVGNDLFGKGDPHYDTSLPQRVQDLEQAKHLLKAAGKEGLNVTLNTSTVATGMLESATVFARQATGAGVTVHLNQQTPSIYFGPVYLKQNFAQSEWFGGPIINWISSSLVKGASFNETHWNNAQFQSLYDQALAESNQGKLQDLYNEMQKILWTEGGYLIWGFYPLLDGVSHLVGGMTPSPLGPLGGKAYIDVWLT